MVEDSDQGTAAEGSPEPNASLSHLPGFIRLASATFFGIAVGIGVSLPFILGVEQETITLLMSYAIRWLIGLFAALVVIAFFGRLVFTWFMSRERGKQWHETLRVLREISDNPDKVSDEDYRRTHLLPLVGPALRVLIPWLSFYSSFAAALAMAGSVAVITTFAVQYLQVERLTEQNNLIRMQADLAQIEQSYTFDMSKADGVYNEISSILIDTQATIQSQEYAIRQIPEAMIMSVIRSDGIYKVAEGDREGEYGIRTVVEYPNNKRLHDRLSAYLIDDRAGRMIVKAGLLAEFGHRDAIPLDKLNEVLSPLSDISNALVATLHRVGPWFDEEAKPENAVWLWGLGDEDSVMPPLRQVPKTAALIFGADLRHVSLVRAQLQGAQLGQAEMKGVNLRSAHLQGADLKSATLMDAVVADAQLQNAQLVFSIMQGADLRRANLQGAVINSAQLLGVDFTGAYLEGTVLHGSLLLGADLTYAYLHGAVLYSAHMGGALLVRAQLQGADLSRAELQLSDLSFARLQGADLREVHLYGAKLISTFFGAEQIRAIPRSLTNYYGDELQYFEPTGSEEGESYDLPAAILTLARSPGALSMSGVDPPPEQLVDEHAEVLMAPYPWIRLKFSSGSEYLQNIAENGAYFNEQNGELSYLANFLIGIAGKVSDGKLLSADGFKFDWYYIRDMKELEDLFGEEHVEMKSRRLTFFDKRYHVEIEGLRTNAYSKAVLLKALEMMEAESEAARGHKEIVRLALEGAEVLSEEELEAKANETFEDWLVVEPEGDGVVSSVEP